MFLLVLGGCAGFIRVDNASDKTFYLRFEHKALWEIPPHTSGVGPTNASPTDRLVEILGKDCTYLGQWGLQQTETITIDANGTDFHVTGGGSTASPLPKADGACPYY